MLNSIDSHQLSSESNSTYNDDIINKSATMSDDQCKSIQVV